MQLVRSGSAVRPARRSLARAAATLAGLLGAGALLAACSPGTVAGWAKSTSAGNHDAVLVSEAAHVRRGIRLHELSQVQTECQGFSDDASVAYDELPTPNQTLTNELSNAYEELEQAGIDCAAAPSLGSAKFHTAERLLAKGSAELAKGEQLLGRLAPGANTPTGGSGFSGTT